MAIVRAAVLLLSLSSFLALSRPRARGLPRAVGRMRQKERHAAGRLSDEIGDVLDHLRSGEYARVRAALAAKARFGAHEWREERLWALDAALGGKSARWLQARRAEAAAEAEAADEAAEKEAETAAERAAAAERGRDLLAQYTASLRVASVLFAPDVPVS